MKKKILTLMATLSVFATSPVLGMEDGQGSNISAKQRVAVVREDDLKGCHTANCAAVREVDQADFQKLYEILIPSDKDGLCAFYHSWVNVQYFDLIANGTTYPWTRLKDYPDVDCYRVIEHFRSIVCVDTNQSVRRTGYESNCTYHIGYIHTTLLCGKTLLLYDSNTFFVKNVRVLECWDLLGQKNYKGFSFDPDLIQRKLKVPKISHDEWKKLREQKKEYGGRVEEEALNKDQRDRTKDRDQKKKF